MILKQISIFIENKTGSLAETTAFLAAQGVNLRALSIADTEDFGILRIIVEDPDTVATKLRVAGYIIKVTSVIAVELEDRPGSLAAVLQTLAAEKLVVEYTYAFLIPKADSAYMIFRVNDNHAALDALNRAGIKTAELADLF